MAVNSDAIIAVTMDHEVHSLLELERFVALERPERISEFPSMLKFMYDDKNVYAEDVVEWAASLDRAVKRGTPAEAARRIRDLCEAVVFLIGEQAGSST